MVKYKGFRKIKHDWKYKNNVIFDTGSKFKIYQAKIRSKPAPKGSGIPLKSSLKWRFDGKQTYKKIGQNRFLITIKGDKKLLKHQIPKRRKYGK